jgi:hypothetical protein
MSVKKTFENLLTPGDLKASVSLDLIQGELQKPEGVRPFEIDEWPILLFLKGVGFQKIIFQPGAPEAVELWVQRIQSYENDFIQDPENFLREEYSWNEKNLDTDEILIECVGTEIRKSREIQPTINTVPPMDAPLGITSEAAEHFLDEVRRQSPQEIFQRILSILVEFERNARNKNQDLWARLVGDVIIVALRCHLLEKANRIAQEHKSGLEPLWSDRDRVAKLLGAYDPKASELTEWAQLFDLCKIELLIGFLESHLSSEAGPQILKLMNYRAQKNPDAFISLIRNQSITVQKLLMQWLAPHWRPKHLAFLDGTLSLMIGGTQDEELFKIWVTALIRCSPKEGFDRLIRYFKVSKWFWKKTPFNPAFQRGLLSALSEHQSVEAFEFLKKIRKNVSKDLMHQVDKIIDTYRKVSH